jgi:hypothetical protein
MPIPVVGNAALYWNRQGRVNCAAHAPFKGSDTWVNEGWQKIAPDVLANTYWPPVLTCETCRATKGG